MIYTLKVSILYTICCFIFKQVLDFRKFFDSESTSSGGGVLPQDPKIFKVQNFLRKISCHTVASKREMRKILLILTLAIQGLNTIPSTGFPCCVFPARGLGFVVPTQFSPCCLARHSMWCSRKESTKEQISRRF